MADKVTWTLVGAEEITDKEAVPAVYEATAADLSLLRREVQEDPSRPWRATQTVRCRSSHRPGIPDQQCGDGRLPRLLLRDALRFSRTWRRHVCPRTFPRPGAERTIPP
jgi:hypothetical protein